MLISQNLEEIWKGCYKSHDACVMVDLEIELELSSKNDTSCNLNRDKKLLDTVLNTCVSIMHKLWVCVDLEQAQQIDSSSSTLSLLKDCIHDEYLIQSDHLLDLFDFVCFSVIEAIFK